MLPFVAFGAAVLFLIVKYSGMLDAFTEAMRGGGRRASEWRMEARRLLEHPDSDSRLEIYREFLERPGDDDEGES
jgi:hypothetical protein